MMNKYIYEGKLKYFYERCLFSRRPITADIFLTDFCNLKCGYCRYDNGSQFMDFDLFRDTVMRLKDLGVLGFILTGGGEPMINPQIDRILDWLNREKISYGINSNGLRLSLETKAKFLKIGIDFASSREYLERKGVDGFNSVVSNLIQFRKENRETILGVQSVIESPDQIENFCDFFRAFDLDYISLRPVESVENKYENDHYNFFRKLDRESQTEKVIVSYKWQYVIPPVRRYRRCHGWWTILNIDVDGSVNYCCNKPWEKVGSIFESNILNKLERFESDMERCEIPCRKSGINDFIRDLKPIEHVEFC